MLPKTKDSGVCSVNSDWHMWTDRSPCGSVDQFNGVSRNQYVSPCQLTWSVNYRSNLNYSSTLLESLKYTKLSMYRPFLSPPPLPGVSVPV